MPAPVPCHYCNKLISQDVEGCWHATHPADEAPWDCYSPSGHRPTVTDLGGRTVAEMVREERWKEACS